MAAPVNLAAEWLETDGLGGFASGTVAGVRTRRYHGVLLCATTPPTGRVMLVNGLEVAIERGWERHDLSAQCYAPEVIHPRGFERIADFRWEPWPTWTFRLPDGGEVQQELFLIHGSAEVVVRWRLVSGGRTASRLLVRPLLSGRDYHSLHHENPAFNFAAERIGGAVRWKPYAGLPAVDAFSNGTYFHEPQWYRNFRYEEETRRGLDDTEDLASPGTIGWDLNSGDALLVLRAVHAGNDATDARGPDRVQAMIAAESERRREFPTPIARAADQYIVGRGTGKSIVAGYPWFTDWGRDTFISLRGLCIATGRLDVAGDILLAWAGTVSEGMLPNRFPDAGSEPEFNSVDASLWFVVAVHDFLAESDRAGVAVADVTVAALRNAIEAILDGYATGTRFGIRMDRDGLLACGIPGVQLTWMDAKVGDWVVTPRIGKPVEVQALWLNALRIGGATNPRWTTLYFRGVRSFGARFWCAPRGHMYDVVDVDHVPGKVDAAFRPNQIFAVGGLPYAIAGGVRAARVVAGVERRLLTPLGLRSLAPNEAGYRGTYAGGVVDRDGAYHQGTVWPWLMGPFVEGWVRIRGSTEAARRVARERFAAPLNEHLATAGLGHISEIADGDPPHWPRGCPFQAWSLGELIRLERVLDDDRPEWAESRAPAGETVDGG